jgi:hypothetical protein
MTSATSPAVAFVCFFGILRLVGEDRRDDAAELVADGRGESGRA